MRRDRISRPAFLVKVVIRMSSGAILSTKVNARARKTSVVVLPVPGPATTKSGRSRGAAIASRCLVFGPVLSSAAVTTSGNDSIVGATDVMRWSRPCVEL